MRHKISRLRYMIAICLLLVMTFAITGCGKEDSAGENDQSQDATNAESDTTKDTEEEIDEAVVTTVQMGNNNYENFIDYSAVKAQAIQTGNLDSFETIYDREYQEAIKAVIETYKTQGTYTITNPLLMLNPYGTNTTGMYVYFQTEEPTSIEYTVSVDSEEIPDFSRILYTNQAGEALTNQEGIVIGLVPGMTNTVTMKAYNVNGEINEESTFTVNVGEYNTVKETILSQTEIAETTQLSNGLFVLFGYDRRNFKEPRHLLMYDNSGVIRAEIPLDIKRADFRIENVDGYLLFPCAENQFALMSPYGKIEAIYEAEGYMFHHDFAYDAASNSLVVLANNIAKTTKEDIVLTLDLNTGLYEETIDFANLLPAAFERATLPEGESKLDWFHENTIMFINGTDLIVSSRELSSIIRVNDIYGEAYVSYIIAEPSIWEGTGYENLLLTQIGEFSNTGGQHTVTYLEDESLQEGQYYLYMFNNNYGYSNTFPEYDWSVIAGIGSIAGKEPEASQFYLYLVDDNAGTYELVQSFDVPASRIVASAQYFGDNIVICSGTAGLFGEYDREGNLLAEYAMDIDEFTYRVFKYTMNQYWFNTGIATASGEKDVEKEFVQGITSTEDASTDEDEFAAFEDYSSSTSNIKGNDYSDFE